MYEAREQSDILTELQQNVGSDASSYEGTFTYDVLASNSIEFSKEEVELEQAYKASFARSSWGEYLEMRAEEHGIFRKNAIKAIGKVTVSGNGIVPLGSIFQTKTGISFKTTKAATISKSGISLSNVRRPAQWAMWQRRQSPKYRCLFRASAA